MSNVNTLVLEGLKEHFSKHKGKYIAGAVGGAAVGGANAGANYLMNKEDVHRFAKEGDVKGSEFIDKLGDMDLKHELSTRPIYGAALGAAAVGAHHLYKKFKNRKGK